MYLVRRSSDINSLKAISRLYSVTRKSHYDVLNLRKNCTSKEIKEAFIQMSKEFHPDKNKSARAQEKFVEILEAYNVLSKPNSRAQYDSMQVRASTSTGYQYQPYTHYNWGTASNTQNYSNYYKTEQKPAGAKDPVAVKKLTNFTIIMLCFVFSFVGFLVQIFVVRESFKANQRRAREKSMKIGEELSRVRSAALENGNEMQTRLLIEKIAAGSNPAVATAALGHALANDKKETESSPLVDLGLLELPVDWTPSADPDAFTSKMSYHTW